MKTIKPVPLGVLHRPFQLLGKRYLSVAVIGFFSFEHPDILLPEVNLWKLVGDKIGDGVPLDEAMPKPQGELLVTGAAYATSDSCTALRVRATIGTIDKELYVVGDRFWDGSKASNPIPFKRMPITWQNAFGGEEVPLNPLGKGAGPTSLDGQMVTLLPNVEDPNNVVSAPDDRPNPAGFGGHDFMWPQRQTKIGTYDERWLAERAPGFPDDFDPAFFNVAPVDQRADGFFASGQSFALANMHPEKARIEARLPNLAARCFVTLDDGGNDTFSEVALGIDTVHLFPDAERGVVIFRGVVEIQEDDARDVKHLVLAAEHIDKPKGAEHYKTVLEQRLDKKRGGFRALRDRDLMPERSDDTPLEAEKFHDMDELLAREGHIEANMRRRNQAELERAREQLRAQDIDPDEHLPKELPPPEKPPALEDIADFYEEQMNEAERHKAEAEERKEQMIAEARALCAENDFDYDAAVAREQAKQGGPPKYSAEDQLVIMRDQAELSRNSGVPLPAVEARLADPDLMTKLEAAEAALRESYRRFAHEMPPAPMLEAEEAQRLGVQLLTAIGASEPLANRDFTRAHLEGADLAGADLSGVFLEGANLRGANLQGANLNGAVLARADLTDADLSGAQASEANLGAATLQSSDLSRAMLKDAVLSKAQLIDTVLTGATIEGAQLLETRFDGTRCDRIVAPNATFLQLELRGVSFEGGELTKSSFIECTLDRVDATSAQLAKATFVACQGTDMKFVGANLREAKLTHGSSFEGADLSKAELHGANLRGTSLVGATLTDAQFDGADLSECDLQRSNFRGATGRGAMMMRINLTDAKLRRVRLIEAVLQRATLCGADFEGANLFRADMLRAEGDDRTSFSGALVTRVRVGGGSTLLAGRSSS